VVNLLDRAIAWFSPLQGMKRAHARSVLSRYDAAKPSRLRGGRGSAEAGDVIVNRDAATVRNIVRDLERNHDLVRGALDVLVRNVAGPEGISIEPQPRDANDDINDDLARDLLNLWRDWTRRPEVTHTLNWIEAQHLACRGWLRDGEQWAQELVGPIPSLEHGTRVPYSLELLEAEMVPADYNPEDAVRAGVRFNDWGRPVSYYVHKRHPGGYLAPASRELKQVPAERMLHLAVRDRLTGYRGISQFASVITRLEDLKDYEESERVAARMAAAIAAYIKRSPEMSWTPPTDFDPMQPRHLSMKAGMILDELLPGEELGMLDPNRPNPNLMNFRNGQLRAVAAGAGVGYSSLSRSYDGTYSAQRQELVEQWGAYQLMTQHFIARFVQPVWERFVSIAVASGQVRVPAGVRPETLAQAAFRGPAMPWIDPLKESTALRMMTRAGFKSLQQVISERGGRLQDTMEQIARERRLARELGIVLDSDAAASTATVNSTDELDGEDAARAPETPENTPASAAVVDHPILKEARRAQGH
jgi:lambda family phage portal protein